MTEEYSEMLTKLNDIVNKLRMHICKHEHCCVKSLLEEMEFDD